MLNLCKVKKSPDLRRFAQIRARNHAVFLLKSTVVFLSRKKVSEIFHSVNHLIRSGFYKSVSSPFFSSGERASTAFLYVFIKEFFSISSIILADVEVIYAGISSRICKLPILLLHLRIKYKRCQISEDQRGGYPHGAGLESAHEYPDKSVLIHRFFHSLPQSAAESQQWDSCPGSC